MGNYKQSPKYGMNKERVDNAIKIINYAIKNQITVHNASVKCGYSHTYVKNVKRDLVARHNNGVLDNQLYDIFFTEYKKYESSQNLNVDSDKDLDISIPNDGDKTFVTEDGDMLNVEWRGVNTNFNQDKVFRDNEDNANVDENEVHYGYPKGHIKTLDQLLDSADVDLNEWRVIRKIVNKWDVTSFKNGYPTTWENFQVKASLERIKEVKAAKNFVEIFEKLASEYIPPAIDSDAIPRFNSESNDENNLLEISLFDLHIGKLGWAGETGENYDTKIARKRFLDAIIMLLKRAKGFTYNKILFPIGNDFFNSDNQFNTTTKGTPQDEDLRWQKTYDLGCQLIVDAIMLLKATGVPVDVIVVPGNHDQERSYYLGSFIDAWFRNDEQVYVNNSAKTRKYIEWGEVLLGFTHGNEEKENSLPLLMATEEKKKWGRTTFHEWHLGHFHKKRNVKFTIFDKGQVLNEELGVTVRYLSSLSGTEEWHYKKGYIGTHKAGEAFVWNDKSGLVGHLNFNYTDFDRNN